jgi:hypothetical protein
LAAFRGPLVLIADDFLTTMAAPAEETRRIIAMKATTIPHLEHQPVTAVTFPFPSPDAHDEEVQEQQSRYCERGYMYAVLGCFGDVSWRHHSSNEGATSLSASRTC